MPHNIGTSKARVGVQTPATLQAAITLLKEKYGPEACGYIDETNLMTREQQEGESVSTYAEDMVSMLNRAGVKELQRWKYFVKGLRCMLQMYVINKDHKIFAQVEQFAKKGEAINQINKRCVNDYFVALAVALDETKSSENSDKLDKMYAAVEHLEQANHNQVKGRAYGVTRPDTRDQRVSGIVTLKVC